MLKLSTIPCNFLIPSGKKEEEKKELTDTTTTTTTITIQNKR